MKKYGLKIGNIGVEFISQQDREKALLLFTKGVDVEIHDAGIRYHDGDGSFSVYERDTKEVIVTCCECEGTFGIDSCGNREYPKKHSWEKEYDTETGYICDACLAQAMRQKEIFEAKKTLNEEEQDDD